MSAPGEPGDSSRLVRFGIFQFDHETGDLFRSGRHVRLPDQPRQVLAMLVSRPGALVTRDELRRALWADDTFVDFDTALNVIINRLRQALDDSAASPRFIETLARRGYRFIAPVSITSEPPAGTASAKPVTEVAHGRDAPFRLWRSYRRATTVALLALGVAIAAVAGGLAWRRTHDGATLPAIRSVAVLPLRDVSPQAREEWFAEGITDAVISDLGRISSLHVISGQSTKRFSRSPQSLAAISRELGADALIEGAAGLTDGRVRVTVRLVHGATDRQLWSGTYERPLADVLTLEGELARAVADGVRLAITGDEQNALAHRIRVNPDAYVSYLRGGHFFELRGDQNIRKSIAHYEQAIALDPAFAAAYGRMAMSYCLLAHSTPPRQLYDQVRGAAGKALARDPAQVDALVAMSQAKFYSDRDWRAARSMLEEILQKYPNHATAHLWYASILTETGPLEQAVAERRQAVLLDPLSNATNKSLAEVLLQTGQYAEAVRVLKNTLDLDPAYADGYGWLGHVYLEMGRREEAVAELEHSVQLSADLPLVARMAYAYGLVGRRSDALRLIATLEDRSHSEWVSPLLFAFAYAGLGDADRAFTFLARAAEQQTPGVMRIKSTPMLDPLKTDPRFGEFVRRLNLPWP